MITRLSPHHSNFFAKTTQLPLPSSPKDPKDPATGYWKGTARSHAPLMIGWAELEALLEQQLPPGTVEWGTQVTGYSESELSVVVTLRETKEGDGGALGAEENLAEAVQEEGGVAPKGWQGRMAQAPAGPEDDQTHYSDCSRRDQSSAAASASAVVKRQPPPPAAAAAAAATPAAAAGGKENGSGGSAFNALSAVPIEEVDENAVMEAEAVDGGYEAAVADATPPPPPAAAPVAAAEEDEDEGEGDQGAVKVVKAGLLLAADGSFSACRKVCIGDGEPMFDVSEGEGGEGRGG